MGEGGLEREETTRRIKESLFGCLERDGLALEPDGRGRKRARCPFHADHTPSLKAWADGNWYCFGCAAGGDAADYVARRYGLERRRDFREILAILGLAGTPQGRTALTKMRPPESPLGEPSVPPRLVTSYDYYWPDGRPGYQVRRYEPKTFRQFRPDGKGGWLAGLDGAPGLLYRLNDALELAAEEGRPVLVFEGEKDVDAAYALGFPSVCNSGGAGNWPDEMSQHLAGREVVIFPDNDDVGRRHAADVARSLGAVGCRVRVVALPGLPPKGDLCDWLAAGHLADELNRVLSAECKVLSDGDVGATSPVPLTGSAVSALDKSPGTLSASSPLSTQHSALSTPSVTRLCDVRAERVSWLWPGYVPLHELTIFDGDPGLGKSALTLDLAARVSRGAALPDGGRSDADGAAGVLLLSCENDLARTVRPRLEGAGADLGRVYSLDGVGVGEARRMPTLLDVAEIEAAIVAGGVRLVVIDPLMAYLPSEINSFRDQDVRRALAPLAELAKRHAVAVVVVRHLNKSSGVNPLYRGGGSIGIIGAARVGILVAADPSDPTGERRIMVPTKNNLARLAPALYFRLVEPEPDRLLVQWEGQANVTATSLLTPAAAPADDKPGARARRFLLEQLAAGPRPTTEIMEAADAEGLVRKTLERVRKELDIQATRSGFGAEGGWIWSLPPDR